MSRNTKICQQILACCLICFSALTWARGSANISQAESLRQSTSSGPNLRSFTTKPNTFHEVEVGQICGKKNNEGVDLICHPNASCALAVDGNHGMCVASPSLIQSQ